MQNQKLENLLNLALSSTQEEREKSPQLNVGYNTEEKTWELIIKYSGNLEAVLGEDIPKVELLNQFAIIRIPESRIEELSRNPQIEFVEKPKRLFFAVNQGRSASCMTALQSEFSPLGEPLTGEGVLVACIDSGIDYSHPDFRNPDGSSRILRLWDQTIQGNPPKGYFLGTEYTKEQIDEALKQENKREMENIVPSRDLSGHGTGVMGIAAGNGAASQGVYRGVAYKSDLLVVKLGTPLEDGFPRTTELMQGIDYAIRQAINLQMPLALNLSFGNNYGSHSGESLIETYLDNAALSGKTSICVGMGNEGSAAIHTSGKLTEGETKEISLYISEYETGMSVQIWKQYVDEMEFVLIHPNGERVGPFKEILGPQRFTIQNTELLIYYGEPGPYSLSQEIYMDMLPKNQYIDSGVWKIQLILSKVVDGSFDLWLPGGGILNEGTRFSFPTPETTLTIPSTAGRVISVGAYNSRYMSYADFSGRGYTRVVNAVKPDLAAPGVDIRTTAVGGGYVNRTGTSFAAPFVTGAAALMMEWGIVRGNDPFLYGEKVKAYLRKGARPLLGGEYPNNRIGYGVLCLRDSFPV